MITDKLYKCIEYSKSIIGNAVTFLMQKEKCPKKLIFSSCVGVYVAFSPFIFFHTVMILLFGWLFALNIPVMFAVSWFINNPYTMVPVYALDCLFGDWLFAFLGID